MSEIPGEPRITSFLVKVASRCNLDCDYCYIYHHADQSWRAMPRLLSPMHRAHFAARLKEYVGAIGLKHCVVVFHGGEPLLYGAAALADFARELRGAVGSDVVLDIGMQTNGLLLTSEAVEVLRQEKIAVSISLDGPREVNNLHRNSRNGRSSFDRVISGLMELKKAPEIFAGVIAVVDPRVSPKTLLQFFSDLDVPKVDFLLPDAHHLRQPPGRQSDPDIYVRWLTKAFGTWFEDYPALQVRTFEALLDALAGLPSQTDAFGFGDVSLLSIETDGGYHDLDVLKITRDGASRLEGTVADTSIRQIAQSRAIQVHRTLLCKDGLSDQCRQCEVVNVCGGGSVPHRYGLNGFRNPTVYCREMKSLITFARSKAFAELDRQHGASVEHTWSLQHAETFEVAEFSREVVSVLVESALEDQQNGLRAALEATCISEQPQSLSARRMLDGANLRSLARYPGVTAWSRAILATREGRAVHAVDGTLLSADGTYVDWLSGHTAKQVAPDVHSPDQWLRLPFGSAIYFESSVDAAKALPIYEEACEIIRKWRPAVAEEMELTCSAVQFVRDPSAHPDKIVSFSDNSVPGALYVSVYRGQELIDPYDLADSLVHEYRHQKLYLLERSIAMTEATAEKVHSPWRDELRPQSGLFHAVFVFVELKRFWEYVLQTGPKYLQARAKAQLYDTRNNLQLGFDTLRQCRLTPAGSLLAKALAKGSGF